jgi:hypothetical protein
MRRASISIHIAIAMLVAMLGILSGFVFLSMDEDRLITFVATNSASIERTRALCRYARLAGELADSLQPQIVTQDTPRQQRFTDRFRELDRNAAELQSLFGDQLGQQQRLADIHRQIRHWLGEVVAALDKPHALPPTKELLTQYDALVATMNSLDQAFGQLEQQVSRSGNAKLRDAISSMNATASAVAAIVIMSVLILWWWSVGSIRRGLCQMEQSLSEVACGKASITLDPNQLPREFHKVVNAYHGVCQHITGRSAIHARQMEVLNEQLLKGLITICSSCKRIRTEQGHWMPLEAYIRSRTTADFTHAVCEDCLSKSLDNL